MSHVHYVFQFYCFIILVHLSENEIPNFWKTMFAHMNLLKAEIDIIWYRESRCYVLLSILQFWKMFDFITFCYFRRARPIVIEFFYSSTALRVENVSFLTHLYLGKKYAYRKWIVKHISAIAFSTSKNVNVFQIENRQLAQTASVLGTGGKPSTRLPPRRLV